MELYGTGVCTIQIDSHGIVDVGACTEIYVYMYVIQFSDVRLDGQRFPCRELESDMRTKGLAWACSLTPAKSDYLF